MSGEGVFIAGMALFFICGLVAVAGGLVAFLFFYGRYADRKISAAWAEAAEATGLTRMDDGKQGRPHMAGTVNGVQMLVDVTTQQHTHIRPDRAYGSRMPWTRVVAQLPASPGVEVHPQGKTFGQKPKWPQRPTGNAALDSQYQVHAPDEINLNDALPEAVRAELLTADPPVHIINDTVLWARARNVKDSALLTQVIQTCARVAAAFP